MDRERGFSLLEALIAITVLSLLISLAVPAMHGLAARNRHNAQVNQLLAHIQYSRSEAILRNQAVVICKSADGNDCSQGSTSWGQGWIVFVNTVASTPTALNPGDNLILSHRDVADRITLTANRDSFSFNAMGGATNGSIVVCDDTGYADARAIIVSITGRARVSETAANGDPLDCDG